RQDIDRKALSLRNTAVHLIAAVNRDEHQWRVKRERQDAVGGHSPQRFAVARRYDGHACRKAAHNPPLEHGIKSHGKKNYTDGILGITSCARRFIEAIHLSLSSQSCAIIRSVPKPPVVSHNSSRRCLTVFVSPIMQRCLSAYSGVTSLSPTDGSCLTRFVILVSASSRSIYLNERPNALLSANSIASSFDSPTKTLREMLQRERSGSGAFASAAPAA